MHWYKKKKKGRERKLEITLPVKTYLELRDLCLLNFELMAWSEKKWLLQQKESSEEEELGNGNEIGFVERENRVEEFVHANLSSVEGSRWYSKISLLVGCK